MTVKTLHQYFADSFGHAEPFSDEELATLDATLTLENLSDIKGIERLQQVEELRLFACGVTDLSPLAALPNLNSLRLLCSTVSDLSPLTELPTLEELEINFCLVEDISPLLELKELKHVALYGNPLSVAASSEQLAQLREKQDPVFGPCIEVDSERHRQLARRMWDTGIHLCFGHVPRSQAVFVKPGPGSDMEVDFREATADNIQEELDADEVHDGETLLSVWHRAEHLEPTADRFRIHWQVRGSADASKWQLATQYLGSDETNPLNDARRDNLCRFMVRFPNQNNYREDDLLLQAFVQKQGVPVPTWLLTLRNLVLAGVRPEEEILAVQFPKFQHPAPRADGGWFYVGLAGFSVGIDEGYFRDRLHLMPVGFSADPETFHGTDDLLLVNLEDENDLRIYWASRYELESFDLDGGDDLTSALWPVFDDYTHMLDYVRAIHSYEDGIIEAEGVYAGWPPYDD